MIRIRSTLAISCMLLAFAACEVRSAVVVWFELVNSPDAPVTSVAQGPGQVLLLNDVNSFEPYDFTVRMMANVTDVSVYSANTTLATDAAITFTSYSLNAPLNGLPTPPANTGVQGPGDIATNFGGATFSGPGYFGANINLGELTFSVDPTNDPETVSSGAIYARVGTGLWAQSDSQGAMIRFGAGPWVSGEEVGAGGLTPVIQFTPEPSMLLLLAWAPIVALRRRRRLH